MGKLLPPPRVVAIVLRVTMAAAAGIAAIVMATSQQTVTIFGLQLEAKFQYTPSLVFFVVANVLACAYSLLVLVVPPASPAARFLLVPDVMVGMLLSGAVAAAGAISELGKNGNTHAGWLPICAQVQSFCDHVRGALISGFIAVILCFCVLIYSSIYSISMPAATPS